MPSPIKADACADAGRFRAEAAPAGGVRTRH